MASEQHPEWEDKNGKTYRVGDWVAIATVAGKSPKMVIGKVLAINATTSKGERLTSSKRVYVGPPAPPESAPDHFHDEWKQERRKYANWKSVVGDGATIKVETFDPLTYNLEPTVHTYRKPSNIVKIDTPDWAT